MNNYSKALFSLFFILFFNLYSDDYNPYFDINVDDNQYSYISSIMRCLYRLSGFNEFILENKSSIKNRYINSYVSTLENRIVDYDTLSQLDGDETKNVAVFLENLFAEFAIAEYENKRTKKILSASMESDNKAYKVPNSEFSKALFWFYGRKQANQHQWILKRPEYGKKSVLMYRYPISYQTMSLSIFSNNLSDDNEKECLISDPEYVIMKQAPNVLGFEKRIRLLFQFYDLIGVVVSKKGTGAISFVKKNEKWFKYEGENVTSVGDSLDPSKLGFEADAKSDISNSIFPAILFYEKLGLERKMSSLYNPLSSGARVADEPVEESRKELEQEIGPEQEEIEKEEEPEITLQETEDMSVIISLIKDIRILCFGEKEYTDPDDDFRKRFTENNSFFVRSIDQFFKKQDGNASVIDYENEIDLKNVNFNDEEKSIKLFKKLNELNKYFPILKLRIKVTRNVLGKREILTRGFSFPAIDELAKLSFLQELNFGYSDSDSISVLMDYLFLYEPGQAPRFSGEIHSIKLFNCDLKEVPTFPESLRDLNISNNPDLLISGAFEATLSNLYSLEIGTQGRDFSIPGYFNNEDFPIEFLVIYGKVFDVQNLSQIRSLKRLILSGGVSLYQDWQNFSIDNLVNLKHLQIVLLFIAPFVFEKIKALKKLEFLDVVANNFSDLKSLSNLKNLKTLNLTAWGGVNAIMLPSRFVDLGGLENLKLNFPVSNLSYIFKRLQFFKRLENLYIRHSELSEKIIKDNILNIYIYRPTLNILFVTYTESFEEEFLGEFDILKYAGSETLINLIAVADFNDYKVVKLIKDIINK